MFLKFLILVGLIFNSAVLPISIFKYKIDETNSSLLLCSANIAIIEILATILFLWGEVKDNPQEVTHGEMII